MNPNIIDIESLDTEGRGVGHLANPDGTPGKVIFVEGALPGERVGFESWRKKKSWEAAKITGLFRESVLRVKPRCPHFGVCGGCSMQHMEPSAQVAVKQRILEDNLWHIGRVHPERMLRPVYGPFWRYRYRARLSVNHVPKKGGMLVGFHERKSRFVADMTSCAILPAHVSDMLVPLRELIGSLSIYDKVPQIELAIGEEEGQSLTVMVLRIMAPLSVEDEVRLKTFADQYGVQWWLQTKGPETVTLFYPDTQQLQYSLPEFSVTMPFKPSDFTQVNHQINQVLVSKAVRLLGIFPDDRVGDLFCGLGNFTLPIARQAKEVVGMEGSEALTERAKAAARLNGLSEKTDFFTRNLFEMNEEGWVSAGRFDRILVDPPRDGALAVCQTIAALTGEYAQFKPSRIVYVSCNPSTLARDAGVLVNVGGYALKLAGVVNMFPHTSHVESIAVFDRV
ncbi:23S rRNA (uracil(1939)-C(5))-methyltransferase RlmD [Oxalobacter vibrioformis]|uniref:23S rRNA (uracil(1939)-C(5))-methyltransferase RlmD n=1 Tax=Oxalobacter vibrioformis TaxID=933080 RepID=A0A9E9LYD5_9BURK|nr:23S rRNA (uracil(1939)-C(5))-methyltransferase RlmD [Oxalobacter vibrioformis]WAW09498.1 23S rRNA (uracil(1939)-C(5))-methyltransferase RlmD [Oxalobacter vibrioformis]